MGMAWKRSGVKVGRAPTNVISLVSPRWWEGGEDRLLFPLSFPWYFTLSVPSFPLLGGPGDKGTGLPARIDHFYRGQTSSYRKVRRCLHDSGLPFGPHAAG